MAYGKTIGIKNKMDLRKICELDITGETLSSGGFCC